MATVHDVAAYILSKSRPLTAMKLQKLVYYSQAWSLVWDKRELFSEPIEAWANGPVVRELYESHRGQFSLSNWPEGNPAALDAKARQTIDSVVGFYGTMGAQYLSDLTHREAPWQQARGGLPEGIRSNAIISLEALRDYYGGLR